MYTTINVQKVIVWFLSIALMMGFARNATSEVPCLGKPRSIEIGETSQILQTVTASKATCFIIMLPKSEAKYSVAIKVIGGGVNLYDSEEQLTRPFKDSDRANKTLITKGGWIEIAKCCKSAKASFYLAGVAGNGKFQVKIGEDSRSVEASPKPSFVTRPNDPEKIVSPSLPSSTRPPDTNSPPAVKNENSSPEGGKPGNSNGSKGSSNPGRAQSPGSQSCAILDCPSPNGTRSTNVVIGVNLVRPPNPTPSPEELAKLLKDRLVRVTVVDPVKHDIDLKVISAAPRLEAWKIDVSRAGVARVVEQGAVANKATIIERGNFASSKDLVTSLGSSLKAIEQTQATGSNITKITDTRPVLQNSVISKAAVDQALKSLRSDVQNPVNASTEAIQSNPGVVRSANQVQLDSNTIKFVAPKIQFKAP